MAVFTLDLVVVWLLVATVSVRPAVTHYSAQSTDRTEQHPARDFSRHTIVQPRIYHGREKRQITTTKEAEDAFRHTDHITIVLDGQDMILDLTLNKKLIPKGFFMKTQQKNGGHKVDRKPNVELCHYEGKVRGKADSWVALSTCHGLSGVVYDGAEMHYIEKKLSHANNDHFLYKHSDLVDLNKTCGYSGHDAMHPPTHSKPNRFKRAAEQNELVRGPYNANKESKYVELVLVIDNSEYKELGESTSKVEHHCKTIANIINGLYAPLNIFIALVGVVIWTEHDEISFSPNGDTTLTNFLHYRREKLLKEHPNDNAQLLTKNSFDNGVVGKALKGPICTYEFSGGVNTDHSASVGLVATTVAHEMGHNFGMEHDTNECKCPEEKCIMAPSSSAVAPTHWSSCSLNYLLLAFSHGMDYCLKNKPEALYDSPVCGNGFVEPGEQCDCGLPEHCEQNSCCNASTCELFSNATCATGECCDLATCRPKSAGVVCRSADYECDLPEYCTGQSEYCPADIYKMDTEVCDNGRAFCYHGFCRTRTDQCKLLWGSSGNSSDEQCYKMNVKGNRHGNCGYDKFNKSYFKCNDEDVLCGMLHCRHLNERLEYGMESVSILSHSFLNLKGSIVACRTAIVDLGTNQVDPGLAPDGAKCGDGKMCVNQKCMPVASLQLASCANNCNNNGWCNNRGHCHCKDGFAPPYCEEPGVGGSDDSGPASDPSARREFVVFMFVFFLGVIPLVLLSLFVWYYVRHNVVIFGSKKTNTKSLQPPTSNNKSGSRLRAITFHPSDTPKQNPSEDNHSLLREDVMAPSGLYGDLFGHFKGFSLNPIKKRMMTTPEPSRAAPPPPVKPPTVPPPPVIVKTTAVTRAQSIRQNVTTAVPHVTPVVTTAAAAISPVPVAKSMIGTAISPNSAAKSAVVASPSPVVQVPPLPPPNPGTSAKPIISSPILENSTCTAKELLSPLKNAPKTPLRAAPERPMSTPDVLTEETKKKESALNRITSFLKPVDKKPTVATHTLPRSNQVKANKILDKNALRSMEISSPILQNDAEVPGTEKPVPNSMVMRAQSMRGKNVTARPNIPTFGSMRQPNGAKRPMSIPSGVRPKSPPPPAPENEPKKITIPNLPGYQKPAPKPAVAQYDDCLNLNTKAPLAKEEQSPTSGDNIYAVIDESPQKVKTNSSSTESMGLLGEIVSEIQNRNFDSIYSTSTLARKKKEAAEAEEKAKNDELYVNTASIYDDKSESVYSNMNTGKSSASSTSSGYIHPSAVNVPVKLDTEPKAVKAEPKLSTFKSNTPSTSASSFKSKKDISPVRRQITPPNLRTRKPSPSRAAPTVPKAVSNSPDVVASCNKTNAKAPDVLSGGTVKKPAIATVKPTVNGLPKAPPKLNASKSVSFKPAEKKLAKTSSDAGKTSPGVTKAARSTSNVASLQQKFESKVSKT